jgi:hypothetical protein
LDLQDGTPTVVVAPVVVTPVVVVTAVVVTPVIVVTAVVVAAVVVTAVVVTVIVVAAVPCSLPCIFGIKIPAVIPPAANNTNSKTKRTQYNCESKYHANLQVDEKFNLK